MCVNSLGSYGKVTDEPLKQTLITHNSALEKSKQSQVPADLFPCWTSGGHQSDISSHGGVLGKEEVSNPTVVPTLVTSSTPGTPRSFHHPITIM